MTYTPRPKLRRLTQEIVYSNFCIQDTGTQIPPSLKLGSGMSAEDKINLKQKQLKTNVLGPKQGRW